MKCPYCGTEHLDDAPSAKWPAYVLMAVVTALTCVVVRYFNILG